MYLIRMSKLNRNRFGIIIVKLSCNVRLQLILLCRIRSLVLPWEKPQDLKAGKYYSALLEAGIVRHARMTRLQTPYLLLTGREP